jgi:hypothetical protein
MDSIRSPLRVLPDWLVQQVTDAAHKDISGNGFAPFDPSRHETGGNTQDNRKSLSATFQDCSSRYHTSMNHPIHTHPFRAHPPRMSITSPSSGLFRADCRFMTSVDYSGFCKRQTPWRRSKHQSHLPMETNGQATRTLTFGGNVLVASQSYSSNGGVQ